MTPGKRPICKHCGSPSVSSDAIAEWDVEAQDWVVAGLLDNEDCNDCGEDGTIIEWEELE